MPTQQGFILHGTESRDRCCRPLRCSRARTKIGRCRGTSSRDTGSQAEPGETGRTHIPEGHEQRAQRAAATGVQDLAGDRRPRCARSACRRGRPGRPAGHRPAAGSELGRGQGSPGYLAVSLVQIDAAGCIRGAPHALRHEECRCVLAGRGCSQATTGRQQSSGVVGAPVLSIMLAGTRHWTGRQVRVQCAALAAAVRTAATGRCSGSRGVRVPGVPAGSARAGASWTGSGGPVQPAERAAFSRCPPTPKRRSSSAQTASIGMSRAIRATRR